MKSVIMQLKNIQVSWKCKDIPILAAFIEFLETTNVNEYFNLRLLLLSVKNLLIKKN